jgi:transposase
MATRKPYPTDVSDDEWAFVAPYLALIRQDAPQRSHELREVFNALRWIVRAGASWRMLPHDFTRLGKLSTNRHSAGWQPVASKRWFRT